MTAEEARTSIIWVVHAIEVYEVTRSEIERLPREYRMTDSPPSNADPYLTRELNRLQAAYDQLFVDRDRLLKQEEELIRKGKHSTEAQPPPGN